jgi:hypothetical protein
MLIQTGNVNPEHSGYVPAGQHRLLSRYLVPSPFGILFTFLLCLLLLAPFASATAYVLTPGSMDPFKNGIHYTGTENLTLEIGGNVTIESSTCTGIDSTVPVIIRSSAGKTLSVIVRNDTGVLFGISAPSVSVESGNLEITVEGNIDGEKGLACGIYTSSGNVTISGGSVSTTVASTGHKNKGIYASRYIVISGGRVNATQQGGANTFGLDGGNADTETPDSGVQISGGHIQVNSVGALARNVGVDSKFGTVDISGNTVLVIRIGGSGSKQNYAYNPEITTIHGGGW